MFHRVNTTSKVIFNNKRYSICALGGIIMHWWVLYVRSSSVPKFPQPALRAFRSIAEGYRCWRITVKVENKLGFRNHYKNIFQPLSVFTTSLVNNSKGDIIGSGI